MTPTAAPAHVSTVRHPYAYHPKGPNVPNQGSTVHTPQPYCYIYTIAALNQARLASSDKPRMSTRKTAPQCVPQHGGAPKCQVASGTGQVHGALNHQRQRVIQSAHVTLAKADQTATQCTQECCVDELKAKAKDTAATTCNHNTSAAGVPSKSATDDRSDTTAALCSLHMALPKAAPARNPLQPVKHARVNATVTQ
eukprot:CAMPEP_0119101836 /NCGR_PEP_ID=MMETSP1180-20130426/777_1 /TAXON_ID=3052 ORGANISM="Chlamydomonas cf sp, Strain CCMP681" /NCGR_SAMPLE_ID=MMETSP1180 /ASSEMBLY_ACC=CAM_ASM_000741 /LENGTH=195 /DNA_ID=CAMNT_0007086015 /DNA_START=335 /DNA_END=925 /DNA_ORIENTATION=-